LNRFRDQVNAEAVPGGKPDQKMYDWGREIGYTPKDVDEVYATAAKEKSRKESVAKSDERPEIDKDFAAAGMGKTGGVKETKRQIGAVQARLLGTLGYDMVMTGGKDEEGNPAMISKKEIPAEAYAMTRLQAIKEVVGSNPKLLAAIKKHMPGELAGTGLEGESAAAPATPAANIDDIMGELNRRAAEKDGASKSKKPTSNYVEKR
jgi:Fe-S oxidoreductase